jgi:hypothetical protein
MSLVAAIADLQTKALSISGIKAAPDTIPESANVFPFAISYPRLGRFEFQSAGFGFAYHTIYTEIHVNRTMIGAAVTQATPFIEAFYAKLLADPKLSNSVSEVQAIRHTFGQLAWANVQTIGTRFEIDVKVSVIT